MTLTMQQRLFLKRALQVLFFFVAILGVTRMAQYFGDIAKAPTVGFCFLILVLFSAFFADLPVALITSITAALCFNYYFFPPVGTFHINEFADWISLAAFLLTSIAISRLTASARDHAVQATNLDQAMDRMKQFGIWLIGVPPDRLTLSGMAEQAVNIFSMEYCSIHVIREGRWHHYSGTAHSEISKEIAGRLKYLEDHPTNMMQLVDEHALGVRYMQINQGTSPLALLVVKSKTMPAGAVGVLAYMIGVRLAEMLHDRPDLALGMGR